MAKKTQDFAYDVFLSHDLADVVWCEALATRLDDLNIRVLYDSTIRETDPLKSAEKQARKTLAVWSDSYLSHPDFQKQIERLSKSGLPDRQFIPLVIADCKQLPAIPYLDFRNPADFHFWFRKLLETLDLPALQPQFDEAWGQNELLDVGEADPARRGKLNYQKGKRFEAQVAELFRLLDFDVTEDVHLNGVQFDLRIQQTDPLFPKKAYVECKDTRVGDQERNQAIAQNAVIQASEKNSSCIVVSSQGFASEAREAMEKVGIVCLTYRELHSQLVQLERYADWLIADYEDWQRKKWNGGDWFIRPDFITDVGGKQIAALEFLGRWLGDERKNQLVILGDAGSGKTRLAQFLAYNLARAFRDDPLRHPAPLLIPLGDVRKEISLEGLIIDHFSRCIQKTPDFRRFQHLVCQGKIIVIFDAFDEMADRVSYDEGFRNFRELSRLAELAGKVIITCRSNYFKDLREQRELIADAYTTALYEKLRESSGNEAVYVKHFDDAQILAYLKRARAASWQHDFDKSQQVYDLKGLAQLPLLLDMIVQTLDDFSADERINPAKLYERYTNQWVKHEQRKKRLLLRPEDRLNLMRELAWRVWNNPDNPMRHRELAAFVKEMRDAGAFELRGKDVADIADEIHLATFLKRVGDSGFDFLHRSFMEFFLAGKLFSALSEQREGWSQWLDAPLLNRNVIHFLAMLDVQDQIVAPLQQIVTAEYRPRVSENALVTLYWSGRFRHGMDKRIETLGQFRRQMAGRIPPGIRMQGAKLAEVELQYADLSRADFAGADLSKAKFELAELVAANFADAVLTEASLERADLRQADFQRATLELTSFAGADLSGADFTGAAGYLADKFAGARLSGVRALSGVSGVLDLRRLEPVVQRGDSGWWIPGWPGCPVAFARTDKNDPASDVLAVGGADGVIRIYRAADGALLKMLWGHSDSVLSVAFSPDGERVASGSEDNSVRLWSAKEGRELGKLSGHSARVWSVAFSPDGERVASGSSDKSVRLWSAKEGRCLAELGGTIGPIRSVAFAPQGGLLCGGGWAGRLQFWDLATFETVLWLYHFDEEWLALLPTGEFDFSHADVLRHLRYTEIGAFNSYKAEDLMKDFHAPEAIRARLVKYHLRPS